MSDKFLQLEIRLRLLKNGRQKVLSALAELGEQSIEDVEKELQAMEQRGRKAKIKPTAIELAALESRGSKEIDEHLRVLAIAFQNKTFLPQLRDVQRFLDRREPHGKFKSRNAAAPALFRTLAKLPKEELISLTMPDESLEESDYSILARTIMGR